MVAFYDNKPSIFEAVGDGSYIYRWNIEEVQVSEQANEGEQEAGSNRVQYRCEEALVWGTVTSNKITQAVISAIAGSDHEQKLINEYNAAVLGLLSSEEADRTISAYKAFLERRAAIKAQVDADCAELGIR